MADTTHVWYVEKGPPGGGFAPGAWSATIWRTPHAAGGQGEKIATIGYSPALPLLDSRRQLLYFSQRLADTNSDDLIDENDGLVLVRLDLGTKRQTELSDADERAWPLALDPESGMLLAVQGGHFVLIDGPRGKTRATLAETAREPAAHKAFFSADGQPCVSLADGRALRIERKSLVAGPVCVLADEALAVKIWLLDSGAGPLFRTIAPGMTNDTPAARGLWPLAFIDRERSVWRNEAMVFAGNVRTGAWEPLVEFPVGTSLVFDNPGLPGCLAWLVTADSDGDGQRAPWAGDRSTPQAAFWGH